MALRSRVAMEVRRQRHMKLAYFLLLLVVILGMVGISLYWYLQQPKFQLSHLEVVKPQWLKEELTFQTVIGTSSRWGFPPTQHFVFSERRTVDRIKGMYPELATVTVSIATSTIVVEATERQPKFVVCVEAVCKQGDTHEGLFWSRHPVATSTLHPISLATTTPWNAELHSRLVAQLRALEISGLKVATTSIGVKEHVFEIYSSSSTTWSFITLASSTEDYIAQAYEAAMEKPDFVSAFNEKSLLFLDIRIPSRIFFKLR